METLPILERLYRLPARKLGRPRPLGWVVRKLAARLQRHSTALVLVSLGGALWVVTHVYYYNELVNLESNVEAARAQIEVAEQRRNHIQRNLMQLLRYYARYERDVLKEVTVLREGDKPAEKVASADALARLDAVAEQYPNLQLTKTVQQISESIIVSETAVEARAAEYNDAVNVYSTFLTQFPGNVFGPILGFSPKAYYAPEDRSVLPYRELSP